jgi:hypothetical protein
MADEPINITTDILISIREDISSFRSSVEQRLDRLEEINLKQRLDRLEEINLKQRRDSAGMLVMMRATAGDFDKRVREVKEQIAAFEAREQ